MEFVEVRFLHGPNIWTYRPVIEAWVDIGLLEDYPSNTLPGFHERLSAWLPSLIEHRCSIGEHGGFLKRVREGTWAGHILEHVTLELQNLIGQRTGFGKARSTSKRGLYKVIVRSRQEEVTRACLAAARDLIHAAIEDQPFDVTATLADLREKADSLCLGPSTACIVDAAAERGIPAIRLTAGNLVQLGYGARQRRIWTAETDRTSAIAETISRDKDLTKTLLQSCGVPIPEGRLADSPEDAWDAAADIGGPVVVKPYDGNHGRGVFTDLNTREEVERAYVAALEEGSGVMVERFVPGNAHRLLAVGGKVVAATRGKTLSVIGDGRSTVLDLVEIQINGDPRCGVEEEFPLEPIVLGEEPIALLELERQGYTPQSIPPAGQDVLIKRQGDLAYDVTDEVHPETAELAALAARVVGLDIAGIDMVAEDISRPLEAQRGAVVEVNAGPSLLMHLKPAEGKPRPVGEAIINHLFPEDDNGRIPVVGVTGSHGKTMVAKLVAHLIGLTGKHVGLTCSKGLFLDRRLVEKDDCANWDASHKVLMNRSIQAAVCETGIRTILAEGLAYDRCQVAVVTNLDSTALAPEFYVENDEQLFGVLRTLVDVVLPEGAAVLNAADAEVAKMASLCDGEVIFFATDPAQPVLAEHISAGNRAAYLRNGRLALIAKGEETLLGEIAAIPLLKSDDAPYQVENLLAAVAAAWALGIPPDLIRAGVETFKLGAA